MKRSLVLALVAASLLISCATVPRRVTVDSQEYSATVLGFAAREIEAADLLLEEAAEAAEAGDRLRCLELARVGLRSKVKAQAIAFRALYNARLPVPGQDEPTDPGPAPAAPPATTICGEGSP